MTPISRVYLLSSISKSKDINHKYIPGIVGWEVREMPGLSFGEQASGGGISLCPPF